LVPESSAEAEALARVAANLRHWRRTRGLTQAALAEAVEVEPLAIRSLEGSRQRPSFPLLVRLAVALRIDLGELFRQREMPVRPRGRPPRS
jgi:transcriptional regulator with XRE-family HTH domain